MAYKGNRVIEEATLRELVARCVSRLEILKELSLPTKGSYGYRLLGHFIDLYAIDVSHLLGRERSRLRLINAKIPLSEILEGLHPLYSGRLRQRLIKEGIFEHKCSSCNLSEWLGAPIPLAVDHINGKPHDHRLANLRLLCPNCHALTDTFAGRNTMRALNKKKMAGERVGKAVLRRKEQELLIPLVINAGIDFSKFGWVSKVAKIIGRSPQHTREWMREFMPVIHDEQCFTQVRSQRNGSSVIVDAPVGVEPTRLAAPKSKSGVTTNSTKGHH